MPQHLMTAALDFLRTEGWPIPRRIDLEVIELDFEREDVAWTCYLEAREVERQIIFYSTLKEPVPSKRIPGMLEFVARANYGMAIGNFELDADDGELRFKTSIDLADERLTHGLLAELTGLNVAALSTYLPGIPAGEGGQRGMRSQLTSLHSPPAMAESPSVGCQPATQ